MMHRALRGFGRNRDGASAVEFSLVALPFLLLLFGTIEYGRMLWTDHVLHESAIAGARCMSLPQNGCATTLGVYSASQTLAFVRTNAGDLGVTLSNSDITVSRTASCNGLSDFSQVTIRHTFRTAVPQLMQALSAGLSLQATACFPNQA